MQSSLLIDGATGTELARRGCDTRLPLWSARALADCPELVAAVHRDYVRAGARVVTACTFRTHERNLSAAGFRGRSDQLNARAIRLARRGIDEAGGDFVVRVAGSIAPLEDCFRPDLVPDARALTREHRAQARSLAEAGADLLLVETMNTLREGVAATAAAVLTGLTVWSSWLTDGNGRLPSGEPLRDAVRAAADHGAQAVLINCIPATRVLADAERLAAIATIPCGGYPNVGHNDDVTGWRVEWMLEPAEFAATMLACQAAGLTILGGCCGTQPEHIAALATALS